MRKAKFISLTTVILLFGLCACSNQTSRSNEILPTKEPDVPVFGFITTDPDRTAPTDIVISKEAPTADITLSSAYEPFGAIEDGYEFAVTYIDTITEENVTEQIKTYALAYNLENYDIADCDGLECYLILPKYEGTIIHIAEFSDFDQTKTENIIDTANPVFVLCNPSDIWSNAEITVDHQEKKIVFSPSISLKDGTVILPKEANVITKRRP